MRPDISYCFVVQYFSQFLCCPHLSHLEVDLHVLRYLVCYFSLVIFLNDTNDFSVTGFCDSDWLVVHRLEGLLWVSIYFWISTYFWVALHSFGNLKNYYCLLFD
ncbi:hypothetical protein HAX54_015754 [Datura stramonium]|uniref:Uncharacterized protein n=1 Tax=Datura stramonium TaxID=4076 RepID=A0ABS8UHM4_DATST|nr:hypothetical protein [Datura stramonium]